MGYSVNFNTYIQYIMIISGQLAYLLTLAVFNDCHKFVQLLPQCPF